MIFQSAESTLLLRATRSGKTVGGWRCALSADRVGFGLLVKTLISSALSSSCLHRFSISHSFQIVLKSKNRSFGARLILRCRFFQTTYGLASWPVSNPNGARTTRAVSARVLGVDGRSTASAWRSNPHAARNVFRHSEIRIRRSRSPALTDHR